MSQPAHFKALCVWVAVRSQEQLPDKSRALLPKFYRPDETLFIGNIPFLQNLMASTSPMTDEQGSIWSVAFGNRILLSVCQSWLSPAKPDCRGKRSQRRSFYQYLMFTAWSQILQQPPSFLAGFHAQVRAYQCSASCMLCQIDSER